MAISNPFTFSRLSGIMNQPRSQFSSLFNPMTDTSDNPYQQGGVQNKRLLTNVIPKQRFDMSLAGNEPSPQEDNSLYDPGFVNDFQQRLMEFNKPGPARTAYMDAVRNAPTPQDYAPSKWRRLAAVIGGAAGGINQGAGAGAAIAENINTTPYRAALEGYQNRTAGLGEIANLEAQDQQGAREAFTSAVNVGMQAKDKQRGWDIKRQQMQIDIAKENREYQKTMSDIDRQLAQTNDENQRRILLGQQQQETKRHNQATESIQSGQLGVAQGQLGVAQRNATTAEGNLGVNRRRADTEDWSARNPVPSASNEKQMRDLVLEEMMGEGYRGIDVSTDEKGTRNYDIDPRMATSISAEVDRRVKAKLARGGSGVVPQGTRFILGNVVQQ